MGVMEKAKTFEDLIVWQKAHQLVLEVYRISQEFPKEEVYSLTSQIRRASMSVPANIAEGFGRKGLKDKLRFYTISRSSLHEVKYFLILTKDLNYYDTALLREKLIEIDKMLNSYIISINQKVKVYKN